MLYEYIKFCFLCKYYYITFMNRIIQVKRNSHFTSYAWMSLQNYAIYESLAPKYIRDETAGSARFLIIPGHNLAKQEETKINAIVAGDWIKLQPANSAAINKRWNNNERREREIERERERERERADAPARAE